MAGVGAAVADRVRYLRTDGEALAAVPDPVALVAGRAGQRDRAEESRTRDEQKRETSHVVSLCCDNDVAVQVLRCRLPHDLPHAVPGTACA